MIRERQNGLYILHLVSQASLMMLGYAAWIGCFEIVTSSAIVNGEWNYALYPAVMTVTLVIACLIKREWRGVSLGGNAFARSMLGLKKGAVVAVAILIYLVATKDVKISRLFLFSFLPVLVLLLIASELWLQRVMLRWVFRGSAAESCLLCSPEEDGQDMDDADGMQLRDWIRRQENYGLRIVGALSADRSLSLRARIPYLGTNDRLAEVLRESRAGLLVLTRPPSSDARLASMIELCEEMAVRLFIILDFKARTGRPTSLMHSDGLDLVMFRTEPLQNPIRRIVKRLFDIVFSLLVLVLVFPSVAAVTALMQALQSPGPLFYRQDRSGQGKRPFRIFKFRSMHVHSDDPAVQATRGDGRIYPFGRFLRSCSMDELPQFLNVLRGEMSVVGPRPHLAVHNETWQRLLRPYHLRAYVKPGITGLAQIRGLRGEVGDEEEIRRRILCDIEYVENWSLFLDFWIVLVTIRQVIFPHAKAY